MHEGHPEGCPVCVLAAAAVIVVLAAAPAPAAAAVAEQQDQNDDPPPVVVQAAAQTVIIATHRNTSEAGFFELHRSFHVILRRHFCAEAEVKPHLTKAAACGIIMGKRGDLLGTGTRLSLLRFRVEEIPVPAISGAGYFFSACMTPKTTTANKLSNPRISNVVMLSPPRLCGLEDSPCPSRLR